MSGRQRGLAEAAWGGLRQRAANGRGRLVSRLRRLVPAAVLLRVVIAVAYFAAAVVAVPPVWYTSALYLAIGAGAALAAALVPAGMAPMVASGGVAGAWLVTTSLDSEHGRLWTALVVAVLLYAAHSAAAIAQRFRVTTAVDAEIMLTWLRHLGVVVAATVGFAGLLALFAAYFAAIPATVAVGIGVMAALTVMYVLARSLHKPSSK